MKILIEESVLRQALGAICRLRNSNAVVFDAVVFDDAELEESISTALDAAEKVEVDVNAATMLRLLDTLKYMTGIAERGRGYKCPDNVMPERFLLEYVIELESNNPPSAEIEELEHQLAECERERDMLRKFHHDQQELHERNEANAQTNRLRLLQIVELRAACQMALDEFESRKRDTEEEGYMYIESVAHAKLREVLK